MSSGYIVEICKEPVHIERCNRRRKPADGFETDIKRLVCGQLIPVVFPAPVTFPVEPYIPVAEILSNKILDSSSGTCKVIIVVAFPYFPDKRI